MRDGDARRAAPIVRPGVRVILLDAADRTLLFLCHDEQGIRFWVPPGGGAEPGETAEETARRELWEETGLTTVALVAEIGRQRGIASWGGVTYDCRERWFLARAPEGAINTANFTAEERVSIAGHRWWTPGELAAATERLVPTDLAALVARLLRDGPPAAPLDLRWYEG
jgi:8-oxo-dGTP pyrophosphatase MutT (NUDIX family)